MHADHYFFSSFVCTCAGKNGENEKASAASSQLELITSLEIVPLQRRIYLYYVWCMGRATFGWCIARLCFYLLTEYLKKKRLVSEKITLWILNHVCLLTIKGLNTEGYKNQTNFVAQKCPPARFWARNALTGHSSFNEIKCQLF